MLISYLEANSVEKSEKCVAEGSQYAQWIGLYLIFHLSWVLGLFVHGRLQNLKTSEDTLGHDIPPLMSLTIFLRLLNEEASELKATISFSLVMMS